MKKFGIFLMAVLMVLCAVIGSFDPISRSAVAEPTPTEQSQAAASKTESENEGSGATPPPAAEEKVNETPKPTPEAVAEAEPAPEASAEATPAPQPTEEAEPTPQPAEETEPTPESTGDAEPTPEPTDEAEPEPAPTDEPKPTQGQMVVEGSGPAWIAIKGGRRYGELEDLIPITDETIYISSNEVLSLAGYTIEALKAVNFEPDRDVFQAKSDVVIVSDLDPNGNTRENTVFIWVGSPSSLPKATESPLDKFELSSEEPSDIEIRIFKLANEDGLPTFMMTSVPALSDRQTFAVIDGDGEPVAIQGDSYTPAAPGELRFAVLDESGEVLAKSAKYTAELNAEEAPDGNNPAPENSPDQPEAGNASPADSSEARGNLLDSLAAEINEMGEEESGGAAEVVEEESAEKIAGPDAEATAAIPVEIEITVTEIDYFPGEVSDIAPTFILSGLPSGGMYRYAVMINGDDPAALSGDIYTWAQDGSNILRFLIIDQDGNIVAMSAKYTPVLDFSAPVGKKQAWMADPESGARIYGTLAGLITRAGSGTTIYISVSETIELSGGAGKLSGITLKPDPDVFAAGAYTVKASGVHPQTSKTGGLYVWVDAIRGSGGNTETVKIYVSADNYLPGVWVNSDRSYPTFTLTREPETTVASYEYAVIVDGSTPVLLSGNKFTADIEGKHLLAFVLLDEDMQIVAQSASYEVLFDDTAPVMRVETSANYTLTVTIFDAHSDVMFVSLDGGITWNEAAVQKDGSFGYQYIGAKAENFAPGTILAKDAAGNVATYGQAVTLTAGENGGFGGFGGFGGAGGGGSSRTVSHSSSDDSSTTAYNAVELSAEEAEMSELMLGGELLDLTIKRLSSDGSEGEAAAFTVELAAWGVTDEDEYDSIILTAVTDDEETDEFAILWNFSGTVYKKLASSGIDYLILRVDDHLTAISTAGFTGGSRYNLLKSRGVSSKEFRYSVLMGVPQPQMEMKVSVDGETYPLSDDESNEMYYYDVYPGGPDMLNKTFGA